MRLAWGAALVLALVGCGSSSSNAPVETTASPHGHGHHAPAAETSASDPIDRALDDVARIHGAPGPWAVAGYRMAQYALAKLHLPQGSFDLEITHRTPKKVQFSCIADGAQAYSGASAGKLNLTLVEAPEAELVTIYRNKKTAESLALRPSASFRARYLDADRARARELGREVMQLPDDQVFEEVPAR
ncbi:hypothetical protein AKJ09_02070 [Labilithrix luteola]|uniref:Formylmethanofuran dehydrogenase subunit E domain-containing protein n=1 Tax=Labilithrix luteola TaxID=1391654 RepID=A0A0K1PPU8_9BACT|nr:formylmethanofuran dehydrogenase subunit E family protein [Labilithrix luteola]AKU95406.1 hypothetical protein AKJ09_02070 [Labilithrix luteola]